MSVQENSKALSERLREIYEDHFSFSSDFFTKEEFTRMLNARPVPPTEQQLKRILDEYERWAKGIENRNCEKDTSAYEELLLKTDKNDSDAVLVAVWYLISYGIPVDYIVAITPKEGLFTDTDFLLHDSNRGTIEREMYWNFYRYLKDDIPYTNAVKLTQEYRENFLWWVNAQLMPGYIEVVEERAKFSEFIKNSKWSSWTERINKGL